MDLIEKLARLSSEDLKKVHEKSVEKLNMAKKQYYDAAKGLSELDQEFEQLELEKEINASSQAKITEDLATIKRSQQESLKRQGNLNTILAGYKKELEGLTLEKEKMKKYLEDKRAELCYIKEEASKKISDSNDQLKVAEAELQLAQESLLATQEVKKTKQAALDSINAELKIMEEKMLELKHDDPEKKLQDLRHEIDESIRENETAEKQLEDLKIEKERLKNEVTELENEFKAQVDLNNNIRNDITTNEELLAGELEAAATEIANSIIRENLELAKVLRSALNKNEALANEIKNREQKKVEEEQLMELLKESTETCNKVLADLDAQKKAKEQLEENFVEWKQKVNKKRQQVNNVKKSIQKTKGGDKKKNKRIQLQLLNHASSSENSNVECSSGSTDVSDEYAMSSTMSGKFSLIVIKNK